MAQIKLDVKMTSVWPEQAGKASARAARSINDAIRGRGTTASNRIEKELLRRYDTKVTGFTGRMRAAIHADFIPPQGDMRSMKILTWGYFPARAPGAGTETLKVRALVNYLPSVEHGYEPMWPNRERIKFWMQQMGLIRDFRGKKARVRLKAVQARIGQGFQGIRIIDSTHSSGTYSSILNDLSNGLARAAVLGPARRQR